MRIEPVVTGYVFNEKKTLLVFHKKLKIWLPAGGHIKINETPENALEREFEEELGLKVMLLNKTRLPMQKGIIKQVPLPFYADIHSVGNHQHYCQYYLCNIISSCPIKLNYKELDGFEWFSHMDLFKEKIPTHIKDIGLLAFQKYGELK